jgi:hypothetical protein
MTHTHETMTHTELLVLALDMAATAGDKRYQAEFEAALAALDDALRTVVQDAEKPDDFVLVDELEYEAALKDAMRYRWLRENNNLAKHEDECVEWIGGGRFDEFGCVSISGEELDAAIDAARKEDEQ